MWFKAPFRRGHLWSNGNQYARLLMGPTRLYQYRLQSLVVNINYSILQNSPRYGFLADSPY